MKNTLTMTPKEELAWHKRIIYGRGNPFLYKLYGWYKRTPICWNCQNAVPNREGTRGCSWSFKGIQKPVEGSIMAGNCVYKCPEFISDKEAKHGSPKESS